MELSDVLDRRRAVRAYSADPVNETALHRLIEAAIRAPSAMNEQPWRFTVIRDPLLLDRISDRAKAHVLQANPFGPLPRELESRLADPSFHIFYHAPVLILVSGMAGGLWVTIDCALAAENLMLAACDQGLGSCWIGFAQGWLATAEGRDAIGLPVNEVPIAPIIVGHPAGEAARPLRNEAQIRWH